MFSPTPCITHRKAEIQKPVEILLEKGVDVNAEGGYHGNSPQGASYEDHEEVVQMLIEERVDMNVFGR